MNDVRPTLTVLHLASFTGNIGDNANHLGARSQFDKNLSYHFVYTQLEMREFFWGFRSFDEEFIAYANSFDLLLIGGGNYFELWVERSRSGCSIDLAPEQLQKIQSPVLFYGLGVDAGQGVPEVCKTRFESFLSSILEADNRLVAVRNDGAMATLEHYFPSLPLDRVLQVPDGGFFYRPDRHRNSELLPQSKFIAINLAGDMLETRFPAGDDGLSVDDFLEGLADVLQKVLDADSSLSLMYIPHIFRDLDIIHRAILTFDDRYRRQRLSVAPYLNGNRGCQTIFNLYGHANVCLGMRFHANVVPLAMGCPTLGLACYPQISHLYRELNLPQQCVQVNRAGFANQLSQHLLELPAPKNLAALEAQVQETHACIDGWLRTVVKP